jgi:CrcB protein
VLGGYTTFSTFAWEAFTLGRTGRAWVAVAYVSVSVVGGLAAAWFGYVVGRTFR